MRNIVVVDTKTIRPRCPQGVVHIRKKEKIALYLHKYNFRVFFSNVVVLVITARRKRPKVRLPVKRGSAGLCVLIFTKQNNNELKTALDTLN